MKIFAFFKSSSTRNNLKAMLKNSEGSFIYYVTHIGVEGVSDCVMICDGGGRGFAALLRNAKVYVRLTFLINKVL